MTMKAQEGMTLGVKLVGDDKEREYLVTYAGTADVPGWGGETDVALVQDQNQEVLVARHPEHGWCPVHTEFCRDFVPAIEQERLEDAI